MVKGHDFELLVRQYGGLVWNRAYSITHSREDADDIFQDTFVALVVHLGKLKSQEHIKAWLLRVAAQKSINLVKTAAWKRNTSYEEAHEKMGDGMEPAVHIEFIKGKPLEPDSANTEQGELVMELLQSCPEEQRLLIQYHYYEGLSIGQIAKLLGKAENAVKVQLHRVRKRIADLAQQQTITCQKEGI